MMSRSKNNVRNHCIEGWDSQSCFAQFLFFLDSYAIALCTIQSMTLHASTTPAKSTPSVLTDLYLKAGTMQFLVQVKSQWIFGQHLSYCSGNFLFYARMLKIQNFRYPLVASTFYAVRTIFMIIEKFPYPQNMIWHSPGFISFTVPYDYSRDFFFSGHTGSLTLIMLQFSQFTIKKNKTFARYIWVLVFICLLYIINMLIIIRAHYTIDVIGGLVYSIYFYWLLGQYVVRLDRIASLPYVYIISPLIKKFRVIRQKSESKKYNSSQFQIFRKKEIKDQLTHQNQIQ